MENAISVIALVGDHQCRSRDNNNSHNRRNTLSTCTGVYAVNRISRLNRGTGIGFARGLYQQPSAHLQAMFHHLTCCSRQNPQTRRPQCRKARLQRQIPPERFFSSLRNPPFFDRQQFAVRCSVRAAIPLPFSQPLTYIITHLSHFFKCFFKTCQVHKKRPRFLGDANYSL